MFEATYKLQSGPAATPFDEYAERLNRAFKELLESDPTEPKVQDFLERHPSLVPGAWTPGSISGHEPLYSALITQPMLHGFEARIPDFLWLSNHSSSLYAAMVEIEKPSKRIFTSNEVPTAAYTQAYNQFAQWRIWFDNPAHQQNFFNDYGITAEMTNSLEFNLHLILIYGRRSEFQSNHRLSKLRSKLAKGLYEELMSYDRLSPDHSLSSVVTVKPLGAGRFEVKYVPETFTTSPWNAPDLLAFEGLKTAIDANEEIEPERREFLKDRVTYWREWAKKELRGYTISGKTPGE